MHWDYWYGHLNWCIVNTMCTQDVNKYSWISKKSPNAWMESSAQIAAAKYTNSIKICMAWFVWVFLMHCTYFTWMFSHSFYGLNCQLFVVWFFHCINTITRMVRILIKLLNFLHFFFCVYYVCFYFLIFCQTVSHSINIAFEL